MEYTIKYKSLFFLICYCILELPNSMAQNISFNHLTTDDGLAHNSVMAIYQDSAGFIWAGTRNGVCLYNGKEFITYKYQKDNPNSLIYNNILKITGNSKDEIYFMTSKGISTLQVSKNKISTLIQGSTRSMFYHKQLYITIGNTIYRYDGKQFKEYYKVKELDMYITSIYICDEYILIGTQNQGLFRLMTHDHTLYNLLPETDIIDIFKDSTGKFWIGTMNHGIYVMNEDSITNFRYDNLDPSSISSNFIRCFCEDKQGNIWIGTFNGLNRYNTTNQTFTSYHKSNKENSLTHSSIWTLLCDQQGTLWIGTYFGGINYFHPENQNYRYYQTSSLEKEGLSSPIIGCITEDNQHNLWIATEGGGINKLNPQNGKFKWYKHIKHGNSISHDNIKSTYYDKDKEILWIGTHMGGLNKLDTKNDHFTHYPFNRNNDVFSHSNTIRDIVPYKNELILATHRGVSIFSPNTGRYKVLFQDEHQNISYATSVYIDHHNSLWIGGDGKGVYKYSFDSNELKNYRHNHALKQSISSNSINRIYEDSQKRLWFCTNESGIDLYRYETDDFENFDEQNNGLGSNYVYDVCELSPNKILFITDSGFSILDYSTRRFQNYNKENGVPLSAPNERSVYKTTNGDIYIGGVDGMISFKAESIDYIPQSYNIYPFRLLVNGEIIQPGDKSQILNNSLSYSHRITLKPNQSMFSIEYTTTNYIPFNQDEIEYFLKGFSQNWTSIRKQQAVTYTNLNPGKYTLSVRAKNNPLVPVSKLEIEILPPVYRTVWAYIIYVLCICSVLYYLFRMYNNRIKLQESLKYEKKHLEDIEQLNQTKLRFFTNISHEFRTPLTLIIGQMEMLLQMRSFAPTAYNKILKVYKSSLQLRELISELLDFRKQEQGYMHIKASENNLVDFVYETYLLFQEYAIQHQISFNFHKTHDNISIWFDPKQMQKVVNNLLSNAFKHVKEGGNISVSVRKEKHGAIIEVTDDGSGISPQDIDKIFDRFYQTEQIDSLAHPGTGIGLSLTKGIVELHHGTIDVYSTPGESTTFSVHLPCGKEHLKPEQINELKNEIQIVTSEYQNPAIFLDEYESDILKTESAIEKNKEAKILIIEDNPSLLDMLTKIFETFYTVITASNGAEGWEKVQSEHPNLILSDVIMPKLSGTELCKLIKENLDTCHIPVILLTAQTAIEHNLEGLRIGADDYITKPFNINILLSRCNNLVNNRIMLQEKFSKQPQATPQILATNILDKAFIDQAMKIIEQHLDDTNFNVDIFAREMSIARTKLFNKLKDITGQTPYEFIITVRLKRAAFMLKNNPELNISEIADHLGFSSPRQFTKSFKAKFHVIPQVYRKGEIYNNKEDEAAEEE